MPALQALPVEVLAAVGEHLKHDDRGHVLRPSWLCDRDVAALGATCRLGRAAARLVHPGEHPDDEAYRRMMVPYGQAMDAYVLGKRHLLTLPPTVRGGRRYFANEDLVRLSTEVWGGPQGFNAARRRRAARRDRDAERRQAAKEQRQDRLAETRRKRREDVEALAASDGYVFEDWQEDLVDEYGFTGLMERDGQDWYPPSPKECYDELRERRFKRESRWAYLEVSIVPSEEGGKHCSHRRYTCPQSALKAMRHVSFVRVEGLPHGADALSYLAVHSFLRRTPLLYPGIVTSPLIPEKFRQLAMDVYHRGLKPVNVSMRV